MVAPMVDRCPEQRKGFEDWEKGTSSTTAGIVLVKVVLQGVPATPHPHHHVAPQDLVKEVFRKMSWLPIAGMPTRTKMRILVSPILYLPSETRIMENWLAHWHSSTRSRTCIKRFM